MPGFRILKIMGGGGGDGVCIGIESMHEMRDPENNPRDYGIARKFGWGDEIE